MISACWRIRSARWWPATTMWWRRSRRGSPQFSQQVGEVIGVAQWVGNGVAFVNWFESSPEFSIRLKPGMQLGVTTSATAKLLAAYLPREVTEPLVRGELAERQMDSAEQIERVYSEYAEIRAREIANSLGARRSGLNALSVPIFDRDGQVVVAVTALGMAPRFDADVAGTLAGQMLALSEELSVQMGCTRSDEVADRAAAVRKKESLSRRCLRELSSIERE